MRITLLGNYDIFYSCESYYVESLEALGHEVIPLQEGEVPPEDVSEKASASDLFVWVHGHNRPSEGMGDLLKSLKRLGIPTVSYHHDLFFGLARQKDLNEVDVYKYIDHFFTTDKLMAEWFNHNTEVKGHYLPSGIYHRETFMLPKEKDLDVVFVGNKGYHPEWPYRPQLINWLKDTYKDKFGWYSTEADSKGVKRGMALNQLYADAKVVVGDSLCPNFDYPYYWSDRVWETLGRGGFLIHPHIKGLSEYVRDGVHLRTYEYGNFKQLKYLIDYYLRYSAERERIRKTGYELVRDNHTYKHRWETILNEINNN